MVNPSCWRRKLNNISAVMVTLKQEGQGIRFKPHVQFNSSKEIMESHRVMNENWVEAGG